MEVDNNLFKETIGVSDKSKSLTVAKRISIKDEMKKD